MEILKGLSETVSGAVDFVIEQNRKFNKVTRIKRLIKKESNSIIKSYITLGKHYYNELRDVPNHDMQKLCDYIDSSKKEIKKLQEKLSEVNNEVNLSDFEDFIEDEDPVKVEVTLTCDGASNVDKDKENTGKNKRSKKTK